VEKGSSAHWIRSCAGLGTRLDAVELQLLILPGIEPVFPGRGQLACRRELLHAHTAGPYTKFDLILCYNSPRFHYISSMDEPLQ
jgi:hypothetical protein